MSTDTLMPAAVRFANYPGDRTQGVIGQRMGPNTTGEYLWVVAAEYDAATDKTRLGFSYINPWPDLGGAS